MMAPDWRAMKWRVRLVLLVLGCTSAFSVQAQESADVIAAVMAASQPVILQEVDAPAGLWRAQVTVYPCVDIGEQVASYETLAIIDLRTGETQTVAEQVINCGGLGAYGLAVRHWSDDFLYYTDAREGMPDGMVTDWVSPLWRVQLADLEVERLGQAQFAPAGAWLVTWEAAQISVMPVNAGTASQFAPQPQDLQIVSVRWLPDSSGIIYIQTDTPMASTRSTVTHIDLRDMTQTVLLDTGS
jgi:hypothetical protein